MARSGITKFDVQRARHALLTRGAYPSGDAIRIQLGNTGSKATIHRYLKELADEEGSAAAAPDLSATLQTLVKGLAEQLQTEARETIATATQEFQERARRQQEQLDTLQRELENLMTRLSAETAQLSEERQAHEETSARLRDETVKSLEAQRETDMLRVTLTTLEQHRAMMIKDHEQTRAALEHFRAASKEQRERETAHYAEQIAALQRRLDLAAQDSVRHHEQVTQLNRDGARLIAELTHARDKGCEEEEQRTRLAQQLEQRQTELDQVYQQARQREQEQVRQLTLAERHLQELRVRLASTEAMLAAEKDINARLQTLLSTVGKGESRGG